MRVSLKHRLERLEERLMPKERGPSIAEILKRRRPGEPPPPPLTLDPSTEIGRILPRRMKATESFAPGTGATP